MVEIFDLLSEAYEEAAVHGKVPVRQALARAAAVTETGLYTYPDVAALCSEPEFEDAEQDTLMNPSLIIGVLSDSTERYDRGDKFAHYRRLTSLQDYVLVSQHRPLVEHFARHGEEWILRMAEGLEAILPLPAIGCELPLADIYDKVSFGREDSMTDAK